MRMNRLTFKQQFILGEWLQKHKHELDGLSFAKVGKRCKKDTGLRLTDSNIKTVATQLGIDWERPMKNPFLPTEWQAQAAMKFHTDITNIEVLRLIRDAITTLDTRGLDNLLDIADRVTPDKEKSIEDRAHTSR